MEYNVSIEDSVFRGFGRCLCTHTQIHTEMHIYSFGTQKHIHSIMDTEYIQLWIHVKIHTNVHRNTHTKKGTQPYTNPHIENPHIKGPNMHAHQFTDTQHLSPTCPCTFASLQPLPTHTQSQGLFSIHAHPLPQVPQDKVVYVSLSPSIFIFVT